jgi:hypothetical protein
MTKGTGMNRHDKERGTQIAELAICLPLLCFIVIAVLDGADFVRTHVVLNNAAREGARLSTSIGRCPNGTCNTVPAMQQYVFDYVTFELCPPDSSGNPVCTGLGGPKSRAATCSTPLALSNITVNQSVSWQFQDPSSSQTMQETGTQVTISYPYTFCYLSNFASFFGGMSNTMTLQTSATFRNLY